MNELTIFSGDSNRKLAERICQNLQLPLGDIYHKEFASGELYCQYKTNIRGSDVFIINGASNKKANDYLMQLLIMVDAAKRASAGRITVVLPMFFYSRQDRKDKSRTPISSKLVMDLLEKAGVSRILTMDLHAPQIQGFSNLPVDCLSFEPILLNKIRSIHSNDIIQKDVVMLAPDVGAVKRAESYVNKLKCGFGFISKKRVSDTEVEIESVIGDVKNKYVYIMDDLSESCGTIKQAAEVCASMGALSVTGAIVHNCLSEIGRTRLRSSMTSDKPAINNFYCSNTVDNPVQDIELGIEELDVSELFSKAIYNTHKNQSISELFV